MIRESDMLDHPELFASGPRLVAPPGPLASAPAASANDGKYYYDNVTDNLYLSVGGEWVGVNAWLTDGSDYITLNGENINVDDPNLQLLGVNSFVLGSNGIILGV